ASGDGAPGPWISAIGVVLPPQFALTGAAVAAKTGAASVGSSNSGVKRRIVERMTGNPGCEGGESLAALNDSFW
ncbi:hypothetical protein AAB984_30050, partial [Burkholderia contaminans]|uniref:hypothetical protein n=1 Tax=Burkholderia contaminans TaxID=488447 RepID=UPI0031173C07